jgi:hypothetical protein
MVLFVFSMIAFLGYTRVNGQLVASVAEQRSVDGRRSRGARSSSSLPPGTTAAPLRHQARGHRRVGRLSGRRISVARALP